MICPKCKSKMKVTGTYQAGGSAQTQRVECPLLEGGCGHVGTTVSTLLPSTSASAYLTARRIKQGIEPRSLLPQKKTAPEAV